MKTFLRLALFGFFAAAGVALAISVGVSAAPPPVEQHASTADATAPAPAAKEHYKKIVRPIAPTVASETKPPSILPLAECVEPPSPQVINLPPPSLPVAPEPPVAQQIASPPAEPPAPEPAPGALEFLRRQLIPPPPTPSATPTATPTKEPSQAKPKSTVDGEGDGKLRIHIYDEDIRKVLDLLSEQGNLNILASKNVEGKVSATLNGVDVESALQAILRSAGYVSRRDGDFLFVGTVEDFTNAEQALDRIGTRIYRTNYVTAAELKTLIVPLLTDKVGVASISTPAEAGIATNDSAAGGDKFAGNEVLLVRDFEAVLGQIDQMVAEVDVRPLQVSIEAMILSVQLSDTDKFGVNFDLLKQNPNLKFGIGAPPTSLANFNLDGGLKFGFLDGNLGAFIEALETVGDTNVVANPRLMVLNKHRAEIQIGDKKGYINQTVTETSSAKSVEFLDTGTQLRLRPFISTDGLIRMEIHPELSDGDVKTDASGNTLPNKQLTQVTTNIMVRDGCTVIIGGLIKEQLTAATSQVPVLGNLPFVGFVFRNTVETTERREVLVLITPRIVYEPGSCQEGEKASCEFLRRQSTYADKMSPFGKRSIARRYFRLAQTAYAAGEQHKALRFAEMAVQFDPENRDLIELRSAIWEKRPYGGHPPDSVHTGVPLANPMDSAAMPGWLVDDLEQSPEGPPPPTHPLDRGTPGSSRDIVRPRKLQ